MRLRFNVLAALIAVVAGALPMQLCAADLTIAVATNFKIPATRLVEQFQQSSGQHEVTLVSGSTGKLYTQIVHGAPFDLFLAADQERPALLVQQNRAVTDSQKTFAIGRLALLGPEPITPEILTNGSVQTLAMANPRLAPYGHAAAQTLDCLSSTTAPPAGDTTRLKRVVGENVGQAYALWVTGNADAALVALSLLSPAQQEKAWQVPATCHTPIRQDLVVLSRAAGNPAAHDFLVYLSSAEATAIIHAFGYLTESL